MPSNQENSAVATGLEKVSFHSNPKEGQCQRMFKLPYNCAHFTCQQGNAQNPSSQASTVHELRTSRCTSWIQERQRNKRSNCQHFLDHRKSKRISETHLLLLHDSAKAFDCVVHDKLWNILQEMGIPDHLTCLLRNLYARQEAPVRTRHGTTGWFQIGKGVCHSCILSPAYLTSMQSTSCEMPGQMKHKLESRLLGEISIISDIQMTPPLWQKVKKN